MYEQGRNLEYDGLPVNSAMSMGVHESQSLLWERMVGLSKPFAGYLLPQIREAFPEVRAFNVKDHGSLGNAKVYAVKTPCSPPPKTICLCGRASVSC